MPDELAVAVAVDAPPRLTVAEAPSPGGAMVPERENVKAVTTSETAVE